MRPAADTLLRRTNTALGEVLDFMRVLWAVDHALHGVSKRMEATLGVTGPQRLVVRIVGKFPGIPAGQLAKLLHIHPSTLTGILKRLQYQGLVRRRTDPRDARRLMLSLTAKGRLLNVESPGTVEAAIEQALTKADTQQVESARVVLGGIAASLRLALGVAEESPELEDTF